MAFYTQKSVYESPLGKNNVINPLQIGKQSIPIRAVSLPLPLCTYVTLHHEMSLYEPILIVEFLVVLYSILHALFNWWSKRHLRGYRHQTHIVRYIHKYIHTLQRKRHKTTHFLWSATHTRNR